MALILGSKGVEGDVDVHTIAVHTGKSIYGGLGADQAEKVARDVRRFSKVGDSGLDWPGIPVEVTDGTFEEVVRRYPVVVVDCWAEWCAPCRMVAPVIEELARDYRGRILFGKLNVDSNVRTAQQYGIMSIPTLLVFKNGHLADQLVGAMPRTMLEPQIAKHL
jgi:thioredoxin 1